MRSDCRHRLARLALKNHYGFDELMASSPRYKKHYDHEKKPDTLVVMFSNTRDGLKTKDLRRVEGFYFVDENQKAHRAEAKIVGKDRIALTAPTLSEMKTLYYSWSDNPDGNVFTKEGLPLTPFRLNLK